MIKDKIEKLLNESVKKCGFGEQKLTISFSSLPQICDFQCNGCFALAKGLGKNPFEIATQIVENIEKNDMFVFSVAKPAFINVVLTDKALESEANLYLADERGGVDKHEKSEKVLLDYGGANVAKALHIGHLRSPITGESLKRLYKFMGDEVISDAHLGDWGLQMGLTELQLFDDGKLDFFFDGKGTEPDITLDMLNDAYPKASKRKKEDEIFNKKAEEWTLRIQNKEEPYFTIYKKMRDASVEQIKKHYSELGANFDYWYGESDAADYVEKAIDIISNKGLSHYSDGALVMDVAEEGENIPLPKKEGEEQRYKNPMPPVLIKKQNGASLYATTDIATILMRNLTDKPDRIEYIVDSRQGLHFTQVFRACKKSGISPENQQLIHIGFGTLNGSDGKPFKTRSGDTIKLEDIINLLIEKASEKLKANGVEYDRNLALQIGVAAMKFGDLSNFIAKDYVFDLDKFLAFEGKTGPYLQYTAVRINSVLAKANEKGGEIKMFSDDERNIIKAIFKLQSSYESCYKEKSLNGLCLATYDLASAFSSFYNNHRIIGEKDDEKRKSYISLLNLVKKELALALNILAIDIPKKM